MRDAVSLTSSVVPRGDQTVELSSEQGEFFMRRQSDHVTDLACGVTCAFGLTVVQQIADLIRLQQTRDAEEVHLLIRADVHFAFMSERIALIEHMVEACRGAQRFESPTLGHEFLGVGRRQQGVLGSERCHRRR